MKKLLLTSLFCAFAPFVFAKADAQAGQAKSATCAACHGADGNSVVALWPRLAGQHASYLVKELKDIQSGLRPVPEMAPFVKDLTEQDMQDIAAYYSQQVSQGGVAKAELVEKGEKIYRGGNRDAGIAACSGCHGPDGKGNKGAVYPRLAGQHAEYVEKQLRAFRTGAEEPEASSARINDGDSRIMRDISHRLSDLEIRAVASFIAGLR